MGEPEIKKPSLLSEILPYLITVAIFVWIFRGVDLKLLWIKLRTADLKWFLPPMILYIFVFASGDCLSFGQTYRWFNAKMSVREILECRVGPYLVQVILTPLAEVMFVIYLWKKKGIKVIEAISSNLWTLFVDLSSYFLALTIAVIYNLHIKLVEEINIYWLIVIGLYWFVFLLNLLFWHTPYNRKLSEWLQKKEEKDKNYTETQKRFFSKLKKSLQILRTFTLARWKHYLYIVAVRLLMLSVAMLSHLFALRAVGVELPFPLLMVGLPLVMIGVFLPISVGGYGGPQAIAWLFFYKIGGCASEEAVHAYSLLWSTAFLLGRMVLGGFFIRGFIKGAFPEGISKFWQKTRS